MDSPKQLAPVAAMLVAAMACTTLPFGLGQPDPDDRVATLEAELQAARATAGAAPQADNQTTTQVAPVNAVAQDFTESADAFDLGEAARVEDGALLLGPYALCANDVANFDQPVGCLVICRECGRQLSDFRLSVDFTFEEGLSDREFGVILRWVDEDLDGTIDRPDYLLAIGFNIFDNRWRLYLHGPGEIEPWELVGQGEAGFLLPGRLNEFEAVATEGGQYMDLYLNGSRLTRITGGDCEPGERLVQPWVNAGAVGLLGLGRGVQARFDNFSVEPLAEPDQ